MTRVRILIADDHEILRNGMRVLLEQEPGWVVCGQATTGNDVVAMAIELKPDVILLGISMPGMNGLQAARQIRRSANRAIPHYHADGGKHLYFKKDEVENWLTRNRVSSQNEDEQKAVNEYFCQKARAGKGGLK